MERFVAVLIEHTAGKFPLWLTPEQVVILPISEKFNEYAEKVKTYLKMKEIRAIVDDRNEKIGRKIRDNEMKRIPYMLIVGEKEVENGIYFRFYIITYNADFFRTDLFIDPVLRFHAVILH